MNKHGSPILVATSLAPFNLERQIFCVNSWIQAGFDVASLNCKEEIEKIHSSFPKVRFVEATRTALELTGRPFVFFDDILSLLYKSEYSVCGIINSDIEIRPDERLYEQINLAREGMVYANRREITSPTSSEGKDYLAGFDFFLFHRDVTQLYPPSDFCLGAPWWDYWCALIPKLKGIPCRRGPSGIAFHLTHDINWSFELYHSFGRAFMNFFWPANSPPLKLDATRVPCGAATFQTEKYLQNAISILVFFLTSKLCPSPSPITLSQALADERPLHQWENSQELFNYISTLDGVVGPTIQELRLLHEVESIRSSYSWRMTRPFRELMRFFQKLVAMRKDSLPTN